MYAILNYKKKENKEKALVYNIGVKCTRHWVSDCNLRVIFEFNFNYNFIFYRKDVENGSFISTINRVSQKKIINNNNSNKII